MRFVTMGKRTRSRSNVYVVDADTGETIRSLEFPGTPGVFVLRSKPWFFVTTTEPRNGEMVNHLYIYGLETGERIADMELAYRLQFNAVQRWPMFVEAPSGPLVYAYRPITIGHHRADDTVVAFDTSSLSFTHLEQQVPKCVAGWSEAGAHAHAQILFGTDGLEHGELPIPSDGLPMEAGLWKGPGHPVEPILQLGERPVAHSDLGQPRAILYAPKRHLGVVVCTDGRAILIDHEKLEVAGTQDVALPEGHGMPMFAAALAPTGDTLFVGSADLERRPQRRIQGLALHNLQTAETFAFWEQSDDLSDFELSRDGTQIYGALHDKPEVLSMDPTSGDVLGRAALPEPCIGVWPAH